MGQPDGEPPAMGSATRPASSRRRSTEPCDHMGARPTVDRRVARVVLSRSVESSRRLCARETRLGCREGETFRTRRHEQRTRASACLHRSSTHRHGEAGRPPSGRCAAAGARRRA